MYVTGGIAIAIYINGQIPLVMTGIDDIQVLSILIEVVITAGALFIGIKKKKRFGWAIAATFGLYVVFDLSRMGMIPFLTGIDSFLFLAANIAMLIAVWQIIQEK